MSEKDLSKKKKRRNEKLRMQSEYAGKGELLDIGFAANPNPYLENVTGLDIQLPERKPSNYNKVICCNLNSEDIPAEPDSFDAVIAGDVIEHVENPSHFLREINRVLKDGGRVIISTPQANDWWVTLHNWFFKKWVNDPDPGEHLQNWTMLDMTRLLKKNGFTLEKIEGYYLRFPKIPLQIRVRRFPALSWTVFYIAKKVSEPNTSILVNIDNKAIHVPQ